MPEGINRPITRSFGAQLLKKAQANGAAPAPPAAATKPVARKPVPRPEQAAKASDEIKKPSEGAAAGSAHKVPRKKVVNTLTAVLSHRSKVSSSIDSTPLCCTAALFRCVMRIQCCDCRLTLCSCQLQEACGLNLRPKVLVEDIDKLDGDNELAVVDYIEDIYSYYKTAQVTTIFLPLQRVSVLKLLTDIMYCVELQQESRPVLYMGSQPEINPKMRAILVDWLVEVAHKFELMPESLYLTIYIVDMFLSMQVVPRRELQLVGVAAMLIACKYEEIWAPLVKAFSRTLSFHVAAHVCE